MLENEHFAAFYNSQTIIIIIYFYYIFLVYILPFLYNHFLICIFDKTRSSNLLTDSSRLSFEVSNVNAG